MSKIPELKSDPEVQLQVYFVHEMVINQLL